MWIVRLALQQPLRGLATLRRASISNEGARITPDVGLENPTSAQWPASDDRRYLQVIATHSPISRYVDSYTSAPAPIHVRHDGAARFVAPPSLDFMKRRNLIDLVERFQTHHALQEEREMNNFQASTNGGAVGPRLIR
jgi:hypothetical protein